MGDSERLHQYMRRLHSILDMGVVGETPAEQTRRVLVDSVAALGIDYGELGESASGDAGYVVLCAVGEGPAQGNIGMYASGLEKPRVIFDVSSDADLRQYAVSGLGSLLFWPFSARGKHCVLTLGWKTARAKFVSDEEMQYLEVLAAVVARLLKAMEEQRRIAEHAQTDSLTGLPNRAAVLEYLTAAISAAQREGRSNVALLYIDLNHFKKVNDQYGHAVGDEALRAFSSNLKQVLRKHEMCGRLGGDELCLVLPSFHDREEVRAIARRVLLTLSLPVTVGKDLTLRASASVGIAVYPNDGSNASELVTLADQAMYRAKREGLSAYVFHDGTDSMIVEAPELMDLSRFTRDFVLCYQPIIEARTGRPVAAEILPRWLHPDGMRLPQRFLAAARNQGQLSTLDCAVLKAAAERAANPRVGLRLAFHVNIAESSADLLDALPGLPTQIALEVSEQQIAGREQEYVEFFAACRSRGVRAGLSQFGAGNISLRTLAQIKPDFVKISAADLRGVHVHGGGTDYVKTIIEQAHDLACYVIAEAVETQAEYTWLIASGADALQGFEICSPLAEQDFLAWLRRYSQGVNAG